MHCGSPEVESGTTFSATSRFRFVFLARYTQPMPLAPTDVKDLIRTQPDYREPGT
jgi:hypothetical protein